MIKNMNFRSLIFTLCILLLTVSPVFAANATNLGEGTLPVETREKVLLRLESYAYSIAGSISFTRESYKNAELSLMSSFGKTLPDTEVYLVTENGKQYYKWPEKLVHHFLTESYGIINYDHSNSLTDNTPGWKGSYYYWHDMYRGWDPVAYYEYEITNCLEIGLNLYYIEFKKSEDDTYSGKLVNPTYGYTVINISDNNEIQMYEYNGENRSISGSRLNTYFAVYATPTVSVVKLDGKQLKFDAYNINESNYFKLRDLAFAFRNSAKEFSVDYNSKENVINLIPGDTYKAVGGEMAIGESNAKTGIPTASKITLGGNEININAYNIGGNNYFKLRDLGEILGFGVDWNQSTKIIIIDTSN